EGAGDVALLLDGVAIGNAVGHRAGRQHGLDLHDRGSVEAGTEIGEQLQDLRRRVGLHGIIDPRIRQGAGEGTIILGNDVEIDDEAGSVLTTLTQESAYTIGHLSTLRPCAIPGEGTAWWTNSSKARTSENDHL